MTNDHSFKNSSDQSQKGINRNPSEKNNPDLKKDLPYALKTYLHRQIEAELFSAHKAFIRCSNHLHEFKWLTKNEIDKQHEYYPYQKSIIERISAVLTWGRKTKVPKSREVSAYIKDLKDQISADIEKRLQTEQETTEEIRKKRQSRVKNVQGEKENDSFKRSHSDYKLYENHLGETRWLTLEEFDSQDEFTIEVISLPKKILRISLWAIPVIFILAIIVYFLLANLFNDQPRGYLLVEANESQGQLYINENLKLGTSPDHPIRLAAGSYQITYRKKGFKSSPSFYKIDIHDMDTTTLNFSLTPIENPESAFINLHSSHPDAKVFVRNEFYGAVRENSKLRLPPGDYRIALKKDNYNVLPPFADVIITAGDSLDLTFKFVPRSAMKSKNSGIIYGLIEVSSNIPGADIIIDGQSSGYMTDYIMDKMSLGSHVISLQKDGYTAQPSEKIVHLSESISRQQVHFTLKKSSLGITLKTVPVNGKIYLNEKEIATGTWQGELKPGQYQVRFSSVDFHQTPEPKTIQIGEDFPTDYTFTYTTLFSLLFSPRGISPKNELGSIQLGYIDENHLFHSDPINAPEIQKPDPIKRQVWFLGYAFAYRNPPLNDAIVFTFNIPASINLKNSLWLKMWGYRTEKKYPLAFTSASEINISVNNRFIQAEYTPRYTLSEADELKVETFRINNLVHHGKNRLQISTSVVNTTYFALWKIAIE